MEVLEHEYSLFVNDKRCSAERWKISGLLPWTVLPNLTPLIIYAKDVQ